MEQLTSKMVMVPTSRIGIDPARNKCRVFRALFSIIPEVLEYARKMVEIGYKSDEPISVEPVDNKTGKTFADIRQRAFDALDEFKDVVVHALGEKFTVTANDVREAVRRTFGDAKGNLAVPNLGLVAGYTRMGASIVIANAVRMKKGLALITEVPAVLFNRTLTEAERFAQNVQENSYGGKEPIPYGLELSIARDYMRDDLHNLSDVCRLMGKDPQKDSAWRQGTGTMLDLAAEYPDLDIVGKFASGEITHPRKRYSHAKVVKWLKPDKESNQYATGKTEKPTAEEVLAFLQNPNSKNGEEVKALTPKQLQQAQKHTANGVKKAIINAIQKGDVEGLKALEKGAEAYSLCHSLIQQGHGEAVLAALKAVHKEVWEASDSKK